MNIPPKYLLTSKISEYLQSIEGSRAVIDAITIPPEVETNIRRNSTLKSSLFSARIEGNPLTLNELVHRSSSDQRKREVFNILKGLQILKERSNKDISQSIILQLHKTVMDGLTGRPDLGHYRTEASAIYNSAGIAIYLPPPPRQINSLIERLVKFINSSKEPFVPVRAALAHYIFEKIHPFLDGNGRVGRIFPGLNLVINCPIIRSFFS